MLHVLRKLYLLPVLLLLVAALVSIPLTTRPAQAAATASQATGKMIVVSLSHQWLYASQDGRQVFSTPVMTGRSSLATPT
ncbi:MAG: L,D-transpeptidase, partial [Ktedonobacteraceae bacterium]|nr:L,D-transpeptidase [Ktedonobacteraceae bacterium]